MYIKGIARQLVPFFWTQCIFPSARANHNPNPILKATKLTNPNPTNRKQHRAKVSSAGRK